MDCHSVIEAEAVVSPYPGYVAAVGEGDYISVCNPVAPLLSAAEPSTGIGQKNIAERYALLSDRQMLVSFTSRTYAVKLPILEN